MSLGEVFVSETLGTGILILLGAGVVANVLLSKSKGKDGGWLLITFGWGFAVFAGVYVAYKSGAHLNPAVTLGILASGADTYAPDVPITFGSTLVYFAGEFLGAFLGAVACFLTYRKQFETEEDEQKKLWVFSTAPEVRSPVWNVVTEAWGGRNTGSYLGEPPGSDHNYREKVLGAKPDFVVSEFVNDAGLSPAQVEERYTRLLADFQGIGAEWIVLTPHYVRPDWMGLNRERDIDNDPRPYVAGLRAFTTRHHVALADAALRYGRLWRQGLPYTTVMLNSINHPDARGMKLFADALMELFP